MTSVLPRHNDHDAQIEVQSTNCILTIDVMKLIRVKRLLCTGGSGDVAGALRRHSASADGCSRQSFSREQCKCSCHPFNMQGL